MINGLMDVRLQVAQQRFSKVGILQGKDGDHGGHPPEEPFGCVADANAIGTRAHDVASHGKRAIVQPLPIRFQQPVLEGVAVLLVAPRARGEQRASQDAVIHRLLDALPVIRRERHRAHKFEEYRRVIATHGVHVPDLADERSHLRSQHRVPVATCVVQRKCVVLDVLEVRYDRSNRHRLRHGRTELGATQSYAPRVHAIQNLEDKMALRCCWLLLRR